MMFSFLAYIGALLCIPGMILGLAAEVIFCILIGSSVNCGYSLYLYAAVSYIVVILLVIFGAALACRNKISSPDKYSSFVKNRLKLRFRNPVLLLGIKGFIVNRQSYAVFITIAMISGVLYGVISSWCFGDDVMYMVPWSGMLIFAGVMMFATILVTSVIYLIAFKKSRAAALTE